MSKPITLSIIRNFAHRTFGPIGKATLTGNAALSLSINDGDATALEPDAIEYILTFALQTLQDAYAGAKTPAEAKALWEKKADRIITNSIGARGDGAGVTPWQTIARNIVRPAVKAAFAAKYKAADATERAAMLDEVIAKNADNPAFKAKVDAELAAETARNAALREFGASLTL